MNNIKTSDIVDPSIGQPFTGYSLKFLQDANKEIFAGTVGGISPYFFNASHPICLQGLQRALISGSTYLFGSGYVYYQGEIYFHDFVYGQVINQHAILSAITTNDATADPLIFTDGISRNVHNIRRMVIFDGALGSGTVNYEDLRFNYETWNFVTGGVGFQSTWNEVSGNEVAYKRNGQGMISLKGQFTGTTGSTGTIFTLPTEYRPFYNLTISVGIVNSYANGNLFLNITSGGTISMVTGDELHYTGFSTLPPISLDAVHFYIHA